MHAGAGVRRATRILAVAALLAFGAAGAAEPYERFFGKFEGTALSDGGGELSGRDIQVEIAPADNGFSVEWATVIRKDDGRVKRNRYAVQFRPSDRDNLYRSAMRRNMFGQAVPLDPLEGDPYVWARIEGDVLTVHALLITDEGGYEMQVHERRLVGDGMELRFERVRDGEVLRTVTGRLRRGD